MAHAGGERVASVKRRTSSKNNDSHTYLNYKVTVGFSTLVVVVIPELLAAVAASVQTEKMGTG